MLRSVIFCERGMITPIGENVMYTEQRRETGRLLGRIPYSPEWEHRSKAALRKLSAKAAKAEASATR